ncbi:MAG: NAD-glutamate dehydrogenase, partial [Alphaproteobacteria bacterium]|nr:NAD-glutamate dehydrogenase [Alphaproteobacteria bacterium]
TEILGLMKAQRVKNAVIVPTGAKGGFYPKHLPPASERDAWLAEGTECYRIFIRSLLSLTDNIIGTRIVHPEHIVCHDGDDPYFVVAADKGTATFSDVANAIALERNFWLGDAFASGGSIGYDHKAMGITAKGAWVSVTRHCAEMGMDVQTDPVRVAGCGDMSGDVFGNGMLLSKSIRLVAAFDHRHIFLDPDPDPATSFAERKRLFKLPRSSWADYNPALISRGGGVFPRSAKSIVLSTQVRALLGVSAATLETNALISALLCAPVDVLWFGGIGTYIKASTENNADAGDRINDALRVSAAALQAKVIGEGANLALTQAARIEFAQRGGRINTDFIDNSAGVDCSDHEVNIKIALNTMLRDGQMQEAERRTLLARMTREVSTLVLEDNRLQTLALSIAEAGGPEMLPSFIHLIDHFEAHGQLDRAVEGIASNDEMMRRPSEMRMLTRPELAVLMSTAKLALQAAIERGALERDHGLDDELVAGFPELMHERAHDAIVHHRLRGPIIATQTANRIINRMGMVHPFELAEEEGVDLADVADAFLVCERLFDLPALWSLIEAARLSETVRIHLFEQVAIELRAQMADLLRNAVPDRTPSEAATELAPIVAQLSDGVDSLLPGAAIQQMERFKQRLHDMGVTRTLMARIVHLAKLDGAIGLASLALGQKGDIRALTQAFTALGAALGIDWVQGMAMEMTPSDPWERLLVAGLGRDFHAMRLDWLKRHAGRNPVEAVTQWIAQNRRHIDPFHNIIERAQMSGHTTLAMFAQLAGQARTLLKR